MNPDITQRAGMQMQADGRPQSAVLDTNAVLDGWLFCDARAAALAAAVEAGSVRWLACGRMRDELVRVLAYPQLHKWSPEQHSRALQAFDRFAELHPAPMAALQALRCGDADDQMFIDLALAHSARWLITQDRALLDLRRHAGVHGIRMVSPADWRLQSV